MISHKRMSHLNVISFYTGDADINISISDNRIDKWSQVVAFIISGESDMTGTTITNIYVLITIKMVYGQFINSSKDVGLTNVYCKQFKLTTESYKSQTIYQGMAFLWSIYLIRLGRIKILF